MEIHDTSELILEDIGSPQVLLALGKVSSELGGPLKTMQNIVELLSKDYQTRVIYQKSDEPLRAQGNLKNFELNPFSLSSNKNFLKLLRSNQVTTIIVFGVWHHIFFLIHILNFFSYIKSSIVLIPTGSFTRWDLSQHALVKKLLQPLIRVLVSEIDKVLCATIGEMSESRLYISRRELSCKYYPLITSKNDPMLQNAQASIPTIYFVGRIVPQKNVELLLESYSKVSKSYNLVMIGNGDKAYLENLKLLCMRLDILERVQWLGWQDASKFLVKTNELDLLLITSKQENFSHSALEAMSRRIMVMTVEDIPIALDFEQMRVAQIVPRNVDQISIALAIHLEKPDKAIIENGYLFFNKLTSAKYHEEYITTLLKPRIK